MALPEVSLEAISFVRKLTDCRDLAVVQSQVPEQGLAAKRPPPPLLVSGAHIWEAKTGRRIQLWPAPPPGPWPLTTSMCPLTI